MISHLSCWCLSYLKYLGASIKCYVCDNYSNGTECGHGKLSDKYLFDCPSQAPVNDPDAIHGAKYEICRKIITSIEFDVNDSKPIFK